MYVKPLAIALLAVVCQQAAAQGDFPCSFVYAGKRSQEFLSAWKAETETKKLDSNRTQITKTRTDSATGLSVRCVSIEYQNPKATEWTVYLQNTGTKDTPIVENLQGIDENMAGSGSVVLHHNVGAPANGTDYNPIETTLTGKIRIAGAGGRPTNSDLSYFNLAWGDRGEILVIGWPGQWAANFEPEGDGQVHVVAGQELTHFRLRPGEEVRTPLIVRLPWTGDWIHGQNLWRHWMMAYGMPKPDGQLPMQMMLGYSGRVTQEMLHASEANQIAFIDRYLEERFKLDYWWMDAGWYVQDRGWEQTGTWEVDPKRFPNGLKPISDHAHQKGVKTLLWFEPERVAANTWLSDNHPEWLLGQNSALIARRSSQVGGGEPFVMFNSGDRPIDWSGIHWDPHRLSFHPGPHGEYSVVRFIAPADGIYKVSAVFQAIDPLATTDVHLLQATKSLFNALINLSGQPNHAETDRMVSLSKGDTLDFVVGYGAGRFNNDSTGLDAKITDRSGKTFDAAKEYGQDGGVWSYGYLAPGNPPNPSTFRAYDRKEPGLGNGNRLLDLGNPTAWNWLVNRIDKLIVDNGIDLYRQDFNMDPLDDWRSNDAEDRQGITENKYIVGYLAFWDELKRRHPNMLIDSCASGGRRNDLETMRRAVPLWRSDLPFVPTAHQGMTYGIAMWLPYFGTGTVANGAAPYYGEGVLPVIPYDFWSTACPSINSELDVRQRGYDYDALRRLFAKWRELGPYYYGDYYPLTPFSRSDDAWLGWEFNRPDSGDGIIQVFRRPNSPQDSYLLKLQGLDAKTNYRIVVIDGEKDLESKTWTGAQLMNGLSIQLKAHPSALVLKYQQVR